jgi:hypothetical protein
MLNAIQGPNLNNPEHSFSTPAKLVNARDLTRGMKLYALNCWTDFVRRRLAASQDAQQQLKDRRLMAEIEVAVRSLGAIQFKWSGTRWPAMGDGPFIAGASPTAVEEPAAD